MESLKDLLGCQCHAHAHWGRELAEGPHKGDKTPAYTFPWAKTQYAEDRPLWPTSQSLDLVLNIDGEELTGSNTIAFRVLHPEVTSFCFDAADLHIHDVQLNGKAVKFSVGEKTTLVHADGTLKRGDAGELKITYSCQRPKAGLYFIKPDEKYPKRPVQVWSQGQDDDSRYWFPSFDEPRIKCSMDMRVEVPAGYVATSNGALQNSSRGGKTWTFHWKTQVAIPSYLITLTVGKFAEIRDDWRGKPVTYLCEKGREDEAKLSFGKTPKMMDLFSKVTGTDYPYEKYAQIAAAEFIFGGMENTSATTQTDLTLHPYEVEEDFTSDDLVAHELAHQWFGDLVTCKTWSHGWLNEGWATFMETVFKEQDLGQDETHYYRFEELNLYMGEDRGLYRRPLVSNFYADPGEVWDRHIYQKGALVLNMLRAEVGEEDFWSGVKNYLNTHSGGVAETVDFQRALENSSGRPLQWFFDQWVFKGGFPELKASVEWDSKSKTAKFTLGQTQAVTDLTPQFKISSEVEFFFTDGTSHKLPVVLNQKEQTFCVPLKEKPSYCRFDSGNKILKTMEWNVPMDMAKEQLSKDKDVVGKIWAMKALAKNGSKEGVEILVDRLKHDEFWAVRAEAALALGEARSEDALRALIAALKEEKRSKARSRICSALGEYRDPRAADALIEILHHDKNLFVRSSAAGALGKTKSDKAFEELKSALKEKTWNDYLAAQCYSGLRQLRDARALDLFLAGAAYGAPRMSRVAATSALGEYGLDKKEITEFLKDLLEDPFSRVRFAAADALLKRKDPSAVSRLDDVGHRIIDGHFKAAAFRASRKLMDSLDKPVELIELRESLDKIKEENRKLRDRVQLLEDKP